MHYEHILEASLAIRIHLVAALIALVIGVTMWLLPKGTKSHKSFGRSFIVLMIITAISAIFIREANHGSFSLIHIFVPMTLIGSWQAVNRIQKKNIKGHVSAVKSLFFLALLIPGLLSFTPGRKLWMVVFGSG